MRSGHYGNLKSENILERIVGNLGKDRLFLDSNVQITRLIKGCGRNTLEIPRTRQSKGNKPIYEIIHSRSSQGDHVSDIEPFAKFESGDGFLRLSYGGLLPCDGGEILDDSFHHLSILHDGQASRSDINNNLLNTRNGGYGRIAKTLLECGENVLSIPFE